MFFFSKIVVFLLQPGVWLTILLASGTLLLWTRWKRVGRWIVTAVTLILAAVAVLPLGLLMIGPLEERFPVVHTLEAPVHGIIVLGGAVQQHVTRYRGQPALTDAAERMTETVALARRFPEAQVIFTGGSGLLFDQDAKEVETARLFFARMGIPAERIRFESESRNTWENALYTVRLAQPKPGERWVLVTSAMHMPRSVGVFRKAGLELIPYPVDFQTYGSRQRGLGLNMLSGLAGVSAGLREWAALIAYRVLDRTDEIFPAPRGHTS